MDKVLSVCLKDLDDIEPEDCQLYGADETLIQAEDWLNMIQSTQKSTILKISIRLLTTKAPSPPARPPNGNDRNPIGVDDLHSTETYEEHDDARASKRHSPEKPKSESKSEGEDKIPRMVSRQTTFTTQASDTDKHMALVKYEWYGSVKELVGIAHFSFRKRKDSHLHSFSRRTTSETMPLPSDKSRALVRYARPRNDEIPQNRLPRYRRKSSANVIVNKLEDEEQIPNIYYLPDTKVTNSPSASREELALGGRGEESEIGETTKVDFPNTEELSKGDPQSMPANEMPAVAKPAAKHSALVPAFFLWPIGRPDVVHEQNTRKSHILPTENSTTSVDMGKEDDPIPSLTCPRANLSHQQHRDSEGLQEILRHINDLILEEKDATTVELYRNVTKISYVEILNILSGLEQQLNNEPQNPANSTDAIKLDSKAVYRVSLYDLLALFVELFAFFVPVDFPSELTERYWGALNLLKTVSC